jgi:hypothetical protein
MASFRYLPQHDAGDQAVKRHDYREIGPAE